MCFFPQFRCCGYNSPSFWYRSNGSEFLPISCCEGALLATCTRTEAFTTGCRDAFLSFVKRYGISLGVVFLAIAMLQVSRRQGPALPAFE